MSNKIAMALLMALGLGTASSASAAVSAPWPPPTNVQTAHPVSGYGYAVSKGKRQRTNHAVRVISEAHGSPMSLAAPATGLLGLETVGWSDRLFVVGIRIETGCAHGKAELRRPGQRSPK